MTIVLIDNGSLEPGAHLNLRAIAHSISARVGTRVHAVSWKHSDRIGADRLNHQPAWTIAPFVRAHFARGERQFVFVPFFISAQGAIGSALRDDLEKLQTELGGFNFTFTDGLAARGALAGIVADRIRSVLAAHALRMPPVIVVDHGGPSTASAALRNHIAAQVRSTLGSSIGPLAATSLEGEEYAHNHPLFADQLAAPGFNHGDIVVAPLFLGPGRHAGPNGDLAQIARAAEDRLTSPVHCHFTELVGTHPRVADALAAALRDTLAARPTPSPKRAATPNPDLQLSAENFA